jgi:crotonobetainyl-CoA:carnitine CoA-transferase CaiB-like acyl-CoA transferase
VGPPFWRGTSVYFAAVNRGKRSIAIDMGDERGRAAVRELVAGADVVVENFRPGVTPRLGIGYDDVAAGNAGLIYASINAFGSFGPRAQDTGMSLVNGVLAALLERGRTGHGRFIEFPLYATAISVLGTVIASTSVDPNLPQDRFGSGHPSIVPYAAFEARDGWVVLGAVNAPMWSKLCAGLGLWHLIDDERCATNEARVHNRVFVDGAVAAAVAELDVATLARRLGDLGVLFAPVKTAAEAIRDPRSKRSG